MTNHDRREFLRRGALVSAALAAAPFDALRARSQIRAAETRSAGFGPLRPARDEATGLELIRLPEGFRYVTFGWKGDPLADGSPTPGAHDGMAAIAQEGSLITLVRNHEVNKPAPTIAPAANTYDPQAGGGCVRLVFDSTEEKLVAANAVLGGTHKNCAGGPTPWGTWLSCEEAVDDAHGMFEGSPSPFEKDHGFIFEVPADGSPATPLREMGRFVHEAIAVDPRTGIVYETEDQNAAGFYRFIPNTPGKLADGGRLEMLKVEARDDLMRGAPTDRWLATSWVPIADPLKRDSERGADGLGVYAQGKVQGATTFSRLEGCWQGGGRIFFVSTSGGDAGLGQIWEYDPTGERLRLVFESPASHVLDYPDNITFSPAGGLVLCEDSKTEKRVDRLCGLTIDGQLFPLAENNVQLAGETRGVNGDFREEEWCGATFSPDGKWLFANIQKPGLTVAITGPWADGGL